MSQVLVYTSPARGHLYPVVPILDELRDRGHDVAVRTLASEVPALRERGFAAAATDPGIEAIELDDYDGRTPIANVKRSVRAFGRRAPLGAADLERAIDEVAPDAILVDINCWGALAAAEAWGGPVGAWCPFPLPVPSQDVPPFGPGLAPARGVLGRIRDRLLGPVVTGPVGKVMLPAFNEVRARLGLDAVDGPFELFRHPDLLLYLTAEPFEYPRSDWPANVRMVGPSAWDPPADPPAWLDDVTQPVVLVTTSSEFQDDGRLVETALDALAGDDVYVVATVPSGDPARFDVPPNARVESFVPHGPLLDRAVCAVTHGGMGATQKALAKGVPVCAVPFGRDQHEVARRVEVAGAGTRLPASRLRPDRLRRAVREAIASKPGADRVAEGYRAAGGARAAADHVERELIRTPARR